MRNFNRFVSKKWILLIILLSFLLLSVAVYVGSSSKLTASEQKKSSKLSNYMDNVAKEGFNGSVLVAYKGKILLSKGYGLADKEKKVACTEQTRFMIGSITKQFTSMAIMQLSEKGLLKVSDKIDKYLPGFPHGKEITIHQLLSNTSGLPRDLGEGLKFDTPTVTIEQFLDLLYKQGFDLISQPGKVFNYSNSGFELLGLIIQNVSGASYEEYIQKNIFDPLGMTNSGFGYNRNKNTLLAKGYDSLGNLITKDEFIDCSLWPYAAGEIYSTVGDLYKWDRALNTTKLVSKKTLEKIYTPVLNWYGYGWVIYSPSPEMIYGHNGLVFGFFSVEMRDVGKDTFYVILSNEDKESWIKDTLSSNLAKILDSN